MKRSLLLILLTICSLMLSAQSNTSNYIRTRTMLNSTGTSYLENIQYVDGLGRPTQMNAKNQGGSGTKDIVSLTEYDYRGRVWKEWVPKAIASNGNEVQDLSEFNNPADTHPYTLTNYGYGKLNRVIEQYGSGQAWHSAGKSQKTAYGWNVDDIAFQKCVRYELTSIGLIKNGYYPEYSLDAVMKSDEDGKIYYEFYNKEKQLILIRQKTGIRPADTYYVYDQLGNLHYILPVAMTFLESALTDDLIAKYAYIYEYDNRRRCIKKQLPGEVVIHYVYDKADRLRMTQTSNQEAKKEWTYYKYDAFGRMLLTGIYKGSSTENVTPAIMRSRVESNSILTESYDASKRDLYTYNSYPTDLSKMTTLIANYYDDYSYQSALPVIFNDCKAYVPGVSDPEHTTAKTALTGRKVALLDNPSTYLWSVIRYGKTGLPVQTIEMNVIGGLEKEFVKYSFTGNPLERLLEHSGSAVSTTTEFYTYEYDHADRLSKIYHNDNNAGNILISHMSYDDLGRLSQKKLHQRWNSNEFAETLNYSYNIRNWLTEMNSGSFIEKLYYEDPVKGTACYNGNISAQTVCYPSESSTVSGYTFKYNAMNQLSSANYGEGEHLALNTDRFSENYSYNQSSMLSRRETKGLKTNNTYDVLQSLSMAYDGNRLKNVYKTGGNANSTVYNTELFQNGANYMTEYYYDSNGNLVQDYNKGIAKIEYNFLNLPNIVQMKNGNSIRYTYDALGRKHTRREITLLTAVNVPMGSVYEANSSEINRDVKKYYCSNLLYSEWRSIGSPRILIPDGEIRYGEHNYHIKDHLGSVCAEVDYFSVQYTQKYYPYGMKYNNTGLYGDIAFSGKEKQYTHGLNLYDFEKRHYDMALGGFTTMDPLCEKYPWISPYAYCAGNPMNAVDLKGDSITITRRRGFLGLGKKETVRYENGQLYNLDGSEYMGKVGGFLGKVVNALSELNKTSEGASMVRELEGSKNMFTIQKGFKNEFRPSSMTKAGANLSEVKSVTGISGSMGSGGVIKWNPNLVNGGLDVTGGTIRPAYIGLGHELSHASDANQGLLHYGSDYQNSVTNKLYKSEFNGLLKSEWRAVFRENLIRMQAGIPLRTHYGYENTSTGNVGIDPKLLIPFGTFNLPVNYY